jgi:4-amino-4-deoxy-L-arabinose transferase
MFADGRDAMNRFFRIPGHAEWPSLPGWPLLLVLFLLVLAFNGARGLWAPDEGRYVAAALEMLRRHDFIGIFVNEDTAHFTKPPLTYWTIAASIAALGESEFAARLPNALAYVATALLVLQAGRFLTPRAPWLPMAVYGTMLLPFQAASMITTDTLVTLFTTLAGVSFLRYRARAGPSGAVPVMWLGFGLAFLTKGPPALLSLSAFAAWLAASRDWRGLRNVFLSWGVLVFVVVGLSWFVVVSARFPGLLHYFVGAEVAGRVGADTFRRNGEWYGPLVIFLPTLLIGGLPWVPWFLMSRRGRQAASQAEPVDRLLLWWIGLPLVVHVLAPSRLPLYLLPYFPPLAMWLARRMETSVIGLGRIRAAWLFGCFITVLLAVKLALALVSPVDRDSRAVARLLDEIVPAQIREVVYVDDEPLWELRFYLGAQMRRTWLRRVPYAPTYEPARQLIDALESGVPDESRVFAVNQKSLPGFEQLIRASGGCPEYLGRHHRSVFYRAGRPASGHCPQPAG